MEERKRIVAADPSLKSDIGGVAKMIGKTWKGMSDAEKAKYAKKGASMKTKKRKSSKKTDAEPKKTRKSGKKRALSGFMKFSMKMRPSIMKKNPNIAFGAVGKELGKMWGALSDKEKKSYA